MSNFVPFFLYVEDFVASYLLWITAIDIQNIKGDLYDRIMLSTFTFITLYLQTYSVRDFNVSLTLMLFLVTDSLQLSFTYSLNTIQFEYQYACINTKIWINKMTTGKWYIPFGNAWLNGFAHRWLCRLTTKESISKSCDLTFP